MLDCYLLSFCALKHSGGSFSNMTHAKLEGHDYIIDIKYT
jgi:hypothetical protein